MAERLQPEHSAPQPEHAAPIAQPTKFQLLMRKLLDLPDYRTEGPAAKTMEELGERVKSDPLQAVTELDAYIRGRKTGNFADWSARFITNFAIGAAATGVDVLDIPAKALIKALGAGLFGEAAAAGVEYVTDAVISAGTNKLAELATGVQGVRYASPLSETISTFANTISGFHEVTNGVNLESAFRRFESVPILGAALERGHIAGDRMMNQALETQQGKWLWGLIIVMSKGYNKSPQSGEKKGTPVDPTDPPTTGPQGDRDTSHAAVKSMAAV